MGWRESNVAALVALCVLAHSASATAESRCVACHASLGDAKLRDPAVQILASVHRADAVGCVACHGGDAGDPTVRAHAADTGFVARPKRARIPELCGGCHGDARFVRRFNASLPIDQLALYQLSRHGRAFAAGSRAAPVCSDCHGTHAIAPASAPSSPVSAKNVAALCGHCHSDEETMRGTGLPLDQLADYRKSVHHTALEAGNDRAPSCSGCHGGHGELQVAVASLSHVCVGCHRDELSQFRDSPHREPFDRLGLGECAPCHGAHEVTAAEPLLVSLGPEGSCGKCHGRDARAQAAMRALALALDTARDEAARARARADHAARLGLATPELEPALTTLREAERRLRPQAHRIDPLVLTEPARAVHEAALSVEELVTGAEQRREGDLVVERIVLAVLGLCFVLLVAKARQLARRRRA